MSFLFYDIFRNLRIMMEKENNKIFFDSYSKREFLWFFDFFFQFHKQVWGGQQITFADPPSPNLLVKLKIKNSKKQKNDFIDQVTKYNVFCLIIIWYLLQKKKSSVYFVFYIHDVKHRLKNIIYIFLLIFSWKKKNDFSWFLMNCSHICIFP